MLLYKAANVELQGILFKEDLSLSVISGELWLYFVSAFAITFRNINSAVNTENEHHINPLKKTKAPDFGWTLDLFSESVWVGPVGWIIYLYTAGKTTKTTT